LLRTLDEHPNKWLQEYGRESTIKETHVPYNLCVHNARMHSIHGYTSSYQGQITLQTMRLNIFTGEEHAAKKKQDVPVYFALIQCGPHARLCLQQVFVAPGMSQPS
jgi:hypothetical protein